MAKLTPTELKVLALEAENRVTAALSKKNEEIKNRKEYVEFELNFRKSTVGGMFVELLGIATACDKIMDNDKFQQDRYSKDLEDHAKQKMDSYCAFLKHKAYPLVTLNDVSPKTTDQWGTERTQNLYDHFLHELSLKQLTSDADLAKLLEDLVSEFIKKI